MKELFTDESQTDAEAECLRILYQLFMDHDKREQEGIEPLMKYVSRVKEAETIDELTALLCEDGFLFNASVYDYLVPIPNNSKGVYELQIIRNTVLPYQEAEEDGEELPQPDLEAAKKMLLNMQYSEEEITPLLEKLNEYENGEPLQYELSEREIALLNEELLSLAEIREVCPVIADLLTAQGLVKEGAETEPLYVADVVILLDFRNLFTQENLDLLKTIIVLSMYQSAAPYLSEEYAGEEDAYAAFRAALPRAVEEQAFVHHFVPQERIDTYYSLVEEYLAAMRMRLQENTWMSAESRQKTIEKIDSIAVADILYPYGEFDCEELREGLKKCTNLLEARAQCLQFERKCLMHFISQPYIQANRYFLTDTTLITECRYNPEMNAIIIGAGALVEGMADFTSRETLLGSLGHTIGHELNHGFDVYGIQYDAFGNQNLVLTEADSAVFTEKAKTIADSISKIELLNGIYVNGEQVIGEIMADLGGMRLGLDLSEKTENFDYDTFFKTYAGFFCWYFESHDALESLYASDVHPSAYVRVNYVLGHFDRFYETYPLITEGTAMYMDESERGLVW